MILEIHPERTNKVEIEMIERGENVAIVASNKNASHTLLVILANGTIRRIEGVTEKLGFSLNSQGSVMIE